MKGLKEYTKSGYEKASWTFQPEDLEVDMTGRSCMITGANSGIGYCAALSVARAGGTVHMVCRSQERGQEARESIIQESGNQSVYLHICDLSNTRDVVRFCSEFKATGSPLDVVVHNAGCMVNTSTTNGDNLEVNFATNTLAVYIITNQFLPLLEKSKDPRVVTVSSGGMLTVKLTLDDLNSTKGKFDGLFVYALNKRQQLVMMRQWSKQYTAVHFSSMHPGWADTPAMVNSMPTFHWLMRNKLRTPQQGADTLHWLCVTRRLREFPSGSFFQDRQVVSEHLSAGTQCTGEEEELLMQQLEEIQQRFLPTHTPSPPPVGATALLPSDANTADAPLDDQSESQKQKEISPQ